MLLSREDFVKCLQWELIAAVEGRYIDQMRRFTQPRAWYRKEIKELNKWRFYDSCLDYNRICYETGEFAFSSAISNKRKEIMV